MALRGYQYSWLLLLAALATNPSAVSAEAFPTKPVYIVVPFAAGGILDSLTRLVAEQLQAKWQQAVIIENRVGASGNANHRLPPVVARTRSVPASTWLRMMFDAAKST